MDLWQTEEQISVRLFEGGRADLKVGLPSSAPKGFFFFFSKRDLNAADWNKLLAQRWAA